MTRATIVLLSVAALALTACGRGDRSPVEGSTTPTTATTKGSGRTIADQIKSVETCVGGPKKGKLKVFAPTVEQATVNGGDVLATAVSGTGVELIFWPSVAAAQGGFKDAQNRLISLQQTDAKGYAKLIRTALEVQQNVLIIAPKGALPGPDGAKLTGCIAASLKG